MRKRLKEKIDRWRLEIAGRLLKGKYEIVKLQVQDKWEMEWPEWAIRLHLAGKMGSKIVKKMDAMELEYTEDIKRDMWIVRGTICVLRKVCKNK